METLFIAVIATCISATGCSIVESDPLPLEECRSLLRKGVLYTVKHIQESLPDVYALGLRFECIEVKGENTNYK